MIKRQAGFARRFAELCVAVITTALVFAASASSAAASQRAPGAPRAAANPFSPVASLSGGLRYDVSTDARRSTGTRTKADPLAAEPLYVRIDTPMDQTLTDFRNAHNRRDAALTAKIALQPQALWLTGISNDFVSLYYTEQAAEQLHQELTLVLYNIPSRDCGSFSSGGASSPAAYRSWVRAVAARLGKVDAGVIIEPDALSEQTCWSKATDASNLSLIRYAAKTIAARPHTTVYLDAGNPMWNPPAVMARRLRQVDVAGVRGFSVNTASFATTRADIAYGDAISKLVGGKHFVIDTSRSGNGPLMDGGSVDWCNPPGRALGPAPTTHTGNALVDAYLWIKIPGASDGSCNGGPESGDWWPSYALGLAAHASW